MIASVGRPSEDTARPDYRIDLLRRPGRITACVEGREIGSSGVC